MPLGRNLRKGGLHSLFTSVLFGRPGDDELNVRIGLGYDISHGPANVSGRIFHGYNNGYKAGGSAAGLISCRSSLHVCFFSH